MIKGMAHITGGGLTDNVARILPAGLTAVFSSDRWTTPPIFSLIQERGNVEQAEMYRVFNMGVGMIAVCAEVHVDEVITLVPDARVIGEVVAGQGETRVVVN